MTQLQILLDQNMTDAVGAVFSLYGHTVRRLRDEMEVDALDRAIWTAAIERNTVVVSFDRDFRSIATQFPVGQRGALKRRAGLISLSGVRPLSAPRRVADLMPEIEFAQRRATERRVRFTMSITATSYTVVDNAALRPE